MHILGNGSFCLSTKIIDGEDFFEDKLEYYDNETELIDKVTYFLTDEKLRIEKSMWLHKRTHELFNAKRVSKYLIDLLLQKYSSLQQYEWYK